MNQTDPLIPLDGRSPFLEASDHMIDLIFRTLCELKGKMRLELVSKKFQTRIKCRSSWSETNKLELGQDEANVLINGYKFTYQKAASALATLLDRIIVKEVVLNDMSDVPLNVFLALCHTISQHKDFINLRSIQLRDSFDCSSMLTTFACCGLKNVLEIQCGDWDKFKRIQTLVPAFYSFLYNCHNLKLFNLVIDNIAPIWDTFFPALANCHKIVALDFDIRGRPLTQQNAIKIARFCSENLPKLTSLRLFHSNVAGFEPFEFLNTLDEQIRSKITCFGMTLDPEIPSHHQCLATIYNFFPKLATLNTTCIERFSTQTILEAIGNIFATYGGQRNVYKFELNVCAQNRGSVFTQLAVKKWNQNDKLVQIIVKDGIWKCSKNNVEITLKIYGGFED